MNRIVLEMRKIFSFESGRKEVIRLRVERVGRILLLIYKIIFVDIDVYCMLVVV